MNRVTINGILFESDSGAIVIEGDLVSFSRGGKVSLKSSTGIKASIEAGGDIVLGNREPELPRIPQRPTCPVPETIRGRSSLERSTVDYTSVIMAVLSFLCFLSTAAIGDFIYRMDTRSVASKSSLVYFTFFCLMAACCTTAFGVSLLKKLHFYANFIQFVKYSPITRVENVVFSGVGAVAIFGIVCVSLLFFLHMRHTPVGFVIVIIDGWLSWILYRIVRALVRGGGVIW